MRVLKKHLVIITGVLLAVQVGCSPAPASPTVTPAPTIQAPQATDTAVPPTPTDTATPVPLPTDTPTPTLSPTPQPTDTPTPVPVQGEITEGDAVLLTGPGFDYNFLAQFPAGFILEVTGQSSDGEWLVVRLPDGTLGWIQSVKFALLDGLIALEVFAAPPVPPPTSTPEPQPVVVVSPPNGPEKTTFVVSYSGFPPNEKPYLEIIFVDDGSIVFSETLPPAGNNGKNSFKLNTQIGIQPGDYLIKITGIDGKSGQAAITITGP